MRKMSYSKWNFEVIEFLDFESWSDWIVKWLNLVVIELLNGWIV